MCLHYQSIVEVGMKKIILIVLLLNAYLCFANSESGIISDTPALNTFQKQHIHNLNKEIKKIKKALENKKKNNNFSAEQIKEMFEEQTAPLYLEIEKTKNKQNCYCLNYEGSAFRNCRKIEVQIEKGNKNLDEKLAAFIAECPPSHDTKKDESLIDYISRIVARATGLEVYYLGFPWVDNQNRSESKSSETTTPEPEKKDIHVITAQ